MEYLEDALQFEVFSIEGYGFRFQGLGYVF